MWSRNWASTRIPLHLSLHAVSLWFPPEDGAVFSQISTETCVGSCCVATLVLLLFPLVIQSVVDRPARQVKVKQDRTPAGVVKKPSCTRRWVHLAQTLQQVISLISSSSETTRCSVWIKPAASQQLVAHSLSSVASYVSPWSPNLGLSTFASFAAAPGFV